MCDINRKKTHILIYTSDWSGPTLNISYATRQFTPS